MRQTAPFGTCRATNVGLHRRLKPRAAKHNQRFDGSTSVTEVAVNFKIDVQGVRRDLCKSSLGAAYRTRVCRLEYGRLGFERCILKTHVRSFARRLFGAV